jgi:predicted dehydrogenase
MNHLLRVAVIGAGYMASEHLRAFSACSDVKLVGIHSRSAHRAHELAKLYPGIQVVESIDKLQSQVCPELVVVAVPELACLSICEQVFHYPWTLLIEKPVGHTFSEALQIESLANKLQAKVYVGLNRRFYGATLQLHKAIQSIESPRLVTVLDQEDPSSAQSAGQPDEVVQNWMFANSIHLIDYFSQFCRGDNLYTEVIVPWQPAMPGPVIAQLKFSTGDIGLYQAVWNAPGPWSVSVSTQSLRAELRPLEQLSLQVAGSRSAVLQPADPLDQQFKPGLMRQALAAIDAARGKTTTLATLREANRSMSLVASIYQQEAKAR